jgi:hypothetical protein
LKKDSLELLVVRSTRLGVDESAGDSGDEESVGDLELDGVVDGLVLRGEHGTELLGLGDSSGETVEDESGATQRFRRGKLSVPGEVGGKKEGTGRKGGRGKDVPKLALLVLLELDLDHVDHDLVRDESSLYHPSTNVMKR